MADLTGISWTDDAGGRASARTLMLRAAARVIVRTLGKSAAYIAVAALGWWLVKNSELWWTLAFVVPLWTALALSVFRDKVREEAQRIGGAR